MRKMLASAAAVALAATGVAAQPGNGHGGGNGGGNANNAQHAQGGGSQSRANGNDRGSGNDRGNRGGEERGTAGNGNAGNSNARQTAVERQIERGASNRVERAVVNRNDARGAIDAGRNAVARARIEGDDDRRGEWRDAPLRYVFDGDRGDRDLVRYVGLVDGCPPGLAAKHNGCQPPGQARKNRYFVRDGYGLNWWGLPRYDHRVYRYDSGYLLRLDPNGRIGGYIPLLGGALAVGSMWPQSYGYDEMSPYYARYYGLGPGGSYRFADNVVYRVDPQTSAINAVAALLTGDDFVVGQPIPAGYDVYNVPYSYRDRYADGPDAYYRYSDGYIYQVDPETRLIAAAIELLVS